MPTSSPSLVTGYAAAWCIVFVWSFWLIVSRVADQSVEAIVNLETEAGGSGSSEPSPSSDCCTSRDGVGKRLREVEQRLRYVERYLATVPMAIFPQQQHGAFFSDSNPGEAPNFLDVGAEETLADATGEAASSMEPQAPQSG